MIRLLSLWATILVFSIQHANTQKNEGDMVGKLLQFGYIRESSQNSKNDPPTPEEITEALIKFQKFNGLKETGVYDKPTRKLLNTKRCGNKDIFTENDTSNPSDFYAVARWHKKELTWNLIKFSETQRLSHEDQLKAIQRGLEHWSKVTALTFKKVDGIADIMISFERNSHGDRNPFDGPSGVLAHAFFPGRKAINGDTHFDDAELWTKETDEGTNLEIVAAHEFGHALGLGHSQVSDSLMAPYYRGYTPNFQLHADDIAGIQRLYGMKPKPTTPTTTTEATTTEPTTVSTTVSTTVPTTEPTTEPTTTEVPTTVQPSTTQELTTIQETPIPELPTQEPNTTTKKLPIDLCNRPPKSKIQAAFTDPRGVVYIFLNTGHVISNVTGSRKINEFFPNGPKFVDAAAYSNENSLLLLFRGVYMWMYIFDATSNTFSPAEKAMKKLEINVDAATVIIDNYGWERIFLFTGQYMHEYHQYFMSVNQKMKIRQMWYGAPEAYDAVITNKNEINFLHGNNYTTVDRRYNVVVSVPRSIDDLFKCLEH